MRDLFIPFFILLFGEIICSFGIQCFVLLLLAPRLLSVRAIHTDKDSIIDFTIVVKFILTICLATPIVKLDYALVLYRQVWEHVFIKTTLCNGRVEGRQDVRVITDILDLLTEVE